MECIGQKLPVLSGRGGVGKSTVAANLALALAAAGSHVGPLDVDIHGPSIPKLLGLEGQQPRVVDGMLQPVPVNQRLGVISIGFFLPDEHAPLIWRGPLKFSAIKQFLKDVRWGELEYLVVDCPPGTRNEPLAVAQPVGRPARAVIVTTPQQLAIADVRRCVSFCRSLGLEVAGIIENMSGLVCPHCGEPIDPFKRGGGQPLAREASVPLLGTIPLDPAVVRSGDAGRSLMQADPSSPAARALATIVAALAGNGPRIGPASAPAETGPAEESRMRIAVPLDNGRVSSHFGHCSAFAVYDVDKTAAVPRSKTMFEAPPYEPGCLPHSLHQQEVNVIITGGTGRRAQRLFAQHGIQVVIGAPPLGLTLACKSDCASSPRAALAQRLTHLSGSS